VPWPHPPLTAATTPCVTGVSDRTRRAGHDRGGYASSNADAPGPDRHRPPHTQRRCRREEPDGLRQLRHCHRGGR
jgi:hypothetical protein